MGNHIGNHAPVTGKAFLGQKSARSEAEIRGNKAMGTAWFDPCASWEPLVLLGYPLPPSLSSGAEREQWGPATLMRETDLALLTAHTLTCLGRVGPRTWNASTLLSRDLPSSWKDLQPPGPGGARPFNSQPLWLVIWPRRHPEAQALCKPPSPSPHCLQPVTFIPCILSRACNSDCCTYTRPLCPSTPMKQLGVGRPGALPLLPAGLESRLLYDSTLSLLRGLQE